MASRQGWWPKSRRLADATPRGRWRIAIFLAGPRCSGIAIPHGEWKTTTFMAGLRTSGMIAPMVSDSPINGSASQTHVEQVLVPRLRLGGTVIMDNLGSHKGPGVRVFSPRV
jgi:phage terminase large subunit-like protein